MVCTDRNHEQAQLSLPEMAQQYEAQKKENYCERQEKRYERISKYSLDEDNQRIYGARAQAYGEKAEQFGKIAKSFEKPVEKSGESGIIKANKNDLTKYIGKDIVETDNQHICEWYYANVSDIPNQIDKSLPFNDQVKQAFNLRNKYKHKARVAMSDVETAAELERLRPAPTFEELVENKMKRKNLTQQEALEDILKTASKTNPDVNKEFGL